jgi:hypothetical protein
VKEPVQVDAGNGSEIDFCVVREGLRDEDPRVVDERVDPAKPLNGGGDDPLGGGTIGVSP